MKNILTIFGVLILSVGSLFAQDDQLTVKEVEIEASKGNELKPIAGQYIVVLKENTAKPVVMQKKAKIADREQKEQNTRTARTSNLNKLRNVASKNNIKESNIVAEFGDVLVGFAAKLNDNEVKSLRANSEIAGVYQDYEVELAIEDFCIEDIADECALEEAMLAQTTTCAITNAGGFVDGSGKGTWIWILDTGIDLDHPDLNVQTSPTFAKSFIAGQTVEDGHGHGTHVAGIAAAKNNSIGVVGVSAGARVVPVKVLPNSGPGSFSGIIAGLNHVAMYDIPGDVVNMSIQSYGWSNCENANPTLRDAIRNLGNAGTWVVMAAGNSSGDANRDLPGCVNGTKVLTVGSLTCAHGCSSFSNFGKPPIDWVAVGSSVYSTYKNGSYGTMSGTSMAAPVVAGIVHARNGAPLSAGTVNCGGKTYSRARR